MCVVVVRCELQHFISDVTDNSLLPLYEAKLSKARQSKTMLSSVYIARSTSRKILYGNRSSRKQDTVFRFPVSYALLCFRH
jgi:hypothetical protein